MAIPVTLKQTPDGSFVATMDTKTQALHQTPTFVYLDEHKEEFESFAQAQMAVIDPYFDLALQQTNDPKNPYGFLWRLFSVPAREWGKAVTEEHPDFDLRKRFKASNVT